MVGLSTTQNPVDGPLRRFVGSSTPRNQSAQNISDEYGTKSIPAPQSMIVYTETPQEKRPPVSIKQCDVLFIPNKGH